MYDNLITEQTEVIREIVLTKRVVIIWLLQVHDITLTLLLCSQECQ